MLEGLCTFFTPFLITYVIVGPFLFIKIKYFEGGSRFDTLAEGVFLILAYLSFVIALTVTAIYKLNICTFFFG